MGQKLRYKVLVKKDKIMAVIYNNGSTIDAIPFEEIPIKWSNNSQDLLKVKKDHCNFNTKSDLFGQITQVPIAMMACKYKEEFDEIKQGQVSNITN